MNPKRSRKQKSLNTYDLEESIGYLLHRSSSIVIARFSDDMKPFGFGIQVWRLLAALSQEKPQSLSEIAEHTAAELSYVSRSVMKAEADGLVERTASPDDQRVILVSLTDKGRDIVSVLSAKSDALQHICLQDVSQEDREATLRTLKKIYTNLVPEVDDTTDMNRKLTIARRLKRKSMEPS